MNAAAPVQPPMAIQIPDSIREGAQNVTESLNNLKTGVSDTLSGFSEKAEAGAAASNEFLMSNTLVAKFAFLILVIIVFMFLMNLGIMLIGYFISGPVNPYLVKGMINGGMGQIIPQDPKQSNAIIVNRSNNQSTGAEFTWSVWLYISDLPDTPATTYQHIFSKGTASFDPKTNIATINNGPGMYLNSSTNTLSIFMSTVSATDTNNMIDITNVPLRKWFHVAIRLENTILDVYVNGTISGRLLLQNVPKQNYDDVLVCQNGGFRGNLSDLRYYSSALNVFQIGAIVAMGPTTTSSVSANTSPTYTYLSNLWYSSKL